MIYRVIKCLVLAILTVMWVSNVIVEFVDNIVYVSDRPLFDIIFYGLLIAGVTALFVDTLKKIKK